MSLSRKKQAEQARINTHQAIQLLELLDPEKFAVTSNYGGICIYPRQWGPKKTQWEKALLDAGLQIPADWTGYLSRTSVPQAPFRSNRSDSSLNSSISYQELMSWLLEEEEGSSKKAGTTTVESA